MPGPGGGARAPHAHKGGGGAEAPHAGETPDLEPGPGNAPKLLFIKFILKGKIIENDLLVEINLPH